MRRDTGQFRYLPWLARDVAIWPLSLFVLVAIGIGIVTWRVSLSSTFNAGGQPLQFAGDIQKGTWFTSLNVAILIAIGGVVGIDLQRGFYRAWFSKPMAPWWYYLQRYLLGAAVVLVAPFLLGIALDLALGGGLGITPALIGTIALAYLLVGSATILMSVFHPAGWLFVYLLVIMQRLFGQLLGNLGMLSLQPPPLLKLAHTVLPPFDLIDPMKPMLQGSKLVHVAAYGLAMLLGAMLLLRYRPLGSGGRA